MVLSLLLQVGEAARQNVGEQSSGSDREERLGSALAAEVKLHLEKLSAAQEQMRKNLEAEEKEQKKHITSDDIHDGFANKVCSYRLIDVTWFTYSTLGSSMSRQNQNPRLSQ